MSKLNKEAADDGGGDAAGVATAAGLATAAGRSDGGRRWCW